jgi:hypothetical protein
MDGISPYHGKHTEQDHGVHHRGRHFSTRGESGKELQGTSAGGSTSTAVAAASRQSLDLTIVTAEGDRVTINSNSSVTSAYATYNGTVAGQNSTQVAAAATASSSSFDLSLSVEGDLSPEELKDIAKALQAYSKVLKNVSSGNMEPLLAEAGQISKLDEIASFEANFTSEQAFSAQSTSVSGS